jgi:hypothetical protein
MQTQIHAGIDILGRPLTPIELTQLKEQRATEFRAVQEQQKHASLFNGIPKVALIFLKIRVCLKEAVSCRLECRMRHIARRLNQYMVLVHQF